MARARARPTKPLPEKTPANAARAVAAAVRAAWLRTRDELAKLVLDGADAHVHDLRVGLRRLLSALELAEALEAAPPPKVVKRLERILRSLSPLRDLEVERKTLAKLGEQEPSLAAIAARLERRRSALAKRLARKLAAFAPGPTEALLERCSA